MATTKEEKRQRMRALHGQENVLLLPNPWDLGSLRYFELQGAKALASTSAGFAWTIAKQDNEIRLEESLAHLYQLASHTELPINADFESGFAATERQLNGAIERLEQTGVAAFSIEDRLDDALYEASIAVRRVEQAKQAALRYGGDDFMLVARCEGFLMGNASLEQVIERLQNYVMAGADVVYAPGLREQEHILRVVEAVAPIPLNVLLWSNGLSVSELQELGVKRVSTGSSLAAAARQAYEHASRVLFEQGRLP
ncbi:isocitrate lyase/PEP mutase family protein [Alcaligenes endophyticus]|uniref:Isocitrate lyase/phosphoenolpyruvate mutase family protein n=1 Tax=Alcaligenes endophyticus TaxID=1929088 RepID=A0ABT8EGR9_9BURK|nr:isocitrate lyase/phosphoenolpyruvate mutase family protein [Alcaligenes endophyticus]MCX5589945.1 isocitrate lyase/phosphoenolpyruvate mutase family protein [Alcaligenes endophyticus]MDN4120392.1 isocitrate lyase/phosphoenolpyruvate mutase family protein [Alcaligenes endophyticus]